MSAILTEIVSLLTQGISGIATGVGSGVSTLVNSIFIDATGTNPVLSAFGGIVVCFAGVSLAIGLCRWVMNFLTSLGAKK